MPSSTPNSLYDRWQAPGSVVTGDAVVLDVQLAQLPMRAVGALIDATVMFLGYLIGVLLWATTLADYDPALSGAVLIIFTVVVLIGYPLVFETATRGRSLGKMAMGLRVVSEDGGPERFRQALFRALSAVIEIWMFFGGPAVICSLLSPKGKRIGDVFAGTVVISERGPRLGPPPAMPPELSWWAASLQLSGLGAEQAELARQFLSRAAQLDPALRDQMAYRIAGEVAARISPPPPPGAPPQLVLAAVLAERHRRELDRLGRQAGPPSPSAPQQSAPWPPEPWPPAPRPPAPPAPSAPSQFGPPPPAASSPTGFTPPT
ncbi:RDD family protein [Mycolicibacterium mengxianglii]|uniref:RDD family protein n=1 Tax=Mycolicibacterium mengxianglii TaxID=2736649 RepID=UPI0018D0861C|nr:RDD family protein [Mycolicibacterium mengxianglii]